MRLRSAALVAMTMQVAPLSHSMAQEAAFFDFSRFSAPTTMETRLTSGPAIDTFTLGSDSILTGRDLTQKHNYFSIDRDPGQITNPSNKSITQYVTISAKVDDVHPCGSPPIDPAGIEAMVVEAAGRYGVDTEFAKAIAWAESRFDQARNSSRRARGPMQLMPDTAARFGVSDICDPASNIDGGMRYLRTLLDRFKNPILAAAAYNAGEQAIYDNGGVPAYPETVRYVATVINRQLGISLPRTRSSSSRNRQTTENTSRRAAGDVIGARGAVFASGVMQF